MVNGCSHMSYYTIKRVGNIHEQNEIDKVLADGIQSGKVPHHLERSKKLYDYILGGTKLESSKQEKDLEVLVHESLWDKILFIDSYKTYVRPNLVNHVKYCCTIFSLDKIQDLPPRSDKE